MANIESTHPAISPIRKRWMSSDEALDYYLAYEEQFGPHHALLACHAAFPLIVDPTLLNLIRINFLTDEDIPWMAESDFLLAPFCHLIEPSLGLYQVDPGMREVMLALLRESPVGYERLYHLADFLLAYERRYSEHLRRPDIARIHRWIAWSYLHPQKLLDDMKATLLVEIPKTMDGVALPTHQIHVATMLEVTSDAFEIGPPALEQEYQKLLESARAVTHYWYRSKHTSSESVNTDKGSLSQPARQSSHEELVPNNAGERPVYALLVGINHYASHVVPDLAGCVNDVNAFHELLRSHFGVADENITVLINEAATSNAIREAFQERLLAPLQAWATASRSRDDPDEQPAILFYYSGHGSEAPSPDKPSGLDQTLVPYDGRTDGVYDIKDRELSQWLTQLTPYTTNVTVILDCSHSGSGTRGDRKQVTDVRACSPDYRPQPVAVSLVPTVMRRTIDLSQQREQPLDYVLLAACRNDERAREETFVNQRHGIFTYWLLDVLRQQPLHQPLTYLDLYNQVRHQLQRTYGMDTQRAQTPQCEGDRDRLFLGDLRRRWLRVIAEREGLIWVDSGQAYGLSTGTVLHLYPQGTDTTTTPQELPIATIQVDTVGAVESGCIRIDSQPLTPIPLGARAFMHSYGAAGKRTKIALDFPEGMLLNTIRERLLQSDIYPEVELALFNEDATLRLTNTEETIEIQSGDRQQRYQSYNLRQLNPYRRPISAKDLDPVVRDLLHLVKQASIGADLGEPTLGIGDTLPLNQRMIKVLLLAANSADTKRLRFDLEQRAITEALQRAKFRDAFELVSYFALRADDLGDLLLRHKPDIVHFIGNGDQARLILENDAGNSDVVQSAALKKIFAIFKGNIQCAIFSACYTEDFAKAVAEEVQCVIGISNVIEDGASVAFAAAFYNALGHGENLQNAFNLGLVQLDLRNSPYSENVKIFGKGLNKHILFWERAIREQDWTRMTDGGYSFRIKAEEHNRGHAPMVEVFYQASDGTLSREGVNDLYHPNGDIELQVNVARNYIIRVR